MHPKIVLCAGALQFLTVFFFLQIPIALVSPGKQPSTTQEKRICSTSGWTQVFSNADHSMDLPTFPIVLVCNGIHHIVPSKYINVSKLTDWRLGLILEHLKVVRNLWQEAQVEMMLEPVVDQEFIKVETGEYCLSLKLLLGSY